MKHFQDEYGTPREMTDILPPEDLPVREFNDASEDHPPLEQDVGVTYRPAAIPSEEFAEEAAKRQRRQRLKDYLLKPLLAVSVAATAFAGAVGLDMLGYDIFTSESGDSFLEEVLRGEFFHGDKDQWSSESDHYIDGFDQPQYPTASKAVRSFPQLDNLDPDFDGTYAWGGMGSEAYVRVGTDDSDDWQYLYAGSYWRDYEGAEDFTGTGAVYDKDTNTLTLTDFSCGALDVNMMGNGFKVELVGENTVGQIVVWGAGYGGSVTFTGSGSLTVEAEDNIALLLECEGAASCLMVDSGVKKIELHSYRQALLVRGTALDQGIYFKRRISMTGGNVVTEVSEYTVYDEESGEEKELLDAFAACPEWYEYDEPVGCEPSRKIVFAK